jgi:hypothetical protein
MFDTVDDSNFLLYAAQAYNNPVSIDILEFYEDLEHIKAIKKIINRYKKSKKINVRLYINHFVSLYNVFHIKQLNCILAFKLYNDLEYVKPVLELLGHWSEPIGPIGTRKEMLYSKHIINSVDIENKLKNIAKGSDE